MCSLLLPYTDSKLKFVTKIEVVLTPSRSSCPKFLNWLKTTDSRWAVLALKEKKNSICEPKVYGHFNITHLSMVCPRMGGLDNPGELDFVKRTWVGILTSTTIPGVGHLTWLPSWKVERIWEWVTSGAPSWTYPKFMWASFLCPRIQYFVGSIVLLFF